MTENSIVRIIFLLLNCVIWNWLLISNWVHWIEYVCWRRVREVTCDLRPGNNVRFCSIRFGLSLCTYNDLCSASRGSIGVILVHFFQTNALQWDVTITISWQLQLNLGGMEHLFSIEEVCQIAVIIGIGCCRLRYMQPTSTHLMICTMSLFAASNKIIGSILRFDWYGC